MRSTAFREISVLALACAASFLPAVTFAAPAVLGYELVSSTRFDRTRSDFVYRVRWQNASPAYQNGTFNVTSNAAATQIVDGSIALGAVGENVTGTSTDTFTLRQDRTIAFNPAQLQWQWTGQAVVVGELLVGAPTALAQASIAEVEPVRGGVHRQEVSLDDDGASVPRTRLSVRFAPTATVDQINSFLVSNGLRIEASALGLSVVVLSVPDPGSLTGLELVRNRLVQSGLFQGAWPTTIVASATLPSDVDLTTADSKLGHHLAVGAPAMWNARGALSFARMFPVRLVVADFFGCGVPNTNRYSVNVLNPSDFRNWSLGDFCAPLELQPGKDETEHGYHVLGIATARHEDGDVGQSEDDIAGFIPSEFVQLRAVDLVPDLGDPPLPVLSEALTRVTRTIRSELSLTQRRVVLNMSLKCLTGCPDQESEIARFYAADWDAISTGNSSPAVRRLIVVTAAGNVDLPQVPEPGVRRHAYENFFGAIAIEMNLLQGRPQTALVVENRPARLSTPRSPGFCLAPTSYESGQISAIGNVIQSFGSGDNGVWSLTRPNGAPAVKSGTSMAAPQVAGLAMVLWGLDSTKRADEIRSIIVDTARDTGACQATDDIVEFPAPVIDPYKAALRIDITASDRRVRRAILNPDPNGGIFDYGDVLAFVHAFRDDQGQFDYSRYDLNGDGLTGGGHEVPFDLNYDGQITASVPVVNNPNNVTLSEFAVSDAEALCYYTYSSIHNLNQGVSEGVLFGLANEFPNIPACNGRVQVPPPTIGLASCGPETTGAGTSVMLNGGQRFGDQAGPTGTLSASGGYSQFVFPSYNFMFEGEVSLEYNVRTFARDSDYNVMVASAAMEASVQPSVTSSREDFPPELVQRIGSARANIACAFTVELFERSEIRVGAVGTGDFSREHTNQQSSAYQEEALMALNQAGTGVQMLLRPRDLTGGPGPMGSTISGYNSGSSLSTNILAEVTNSRFLNPGRYIFVYTTVLTVSAGGAGVSESTASADYSGAFGVKIVPPDFVFPP